MSNGSTTSSSRETSSERGPEGGEASRGRDGRSGQQGQRGKREQTPEEIVREWRSKNPDVGQSQSSASVGAGGSQYVSAQGAGVVPEGSKGKERKGKGKVKEKEKYRGMESMYANPARMGANGMPIVDPKVAGSYQTPSPHTAALTSAMKKGTKDNIRRHEAPVAPRNTSQISNPRTRNGNPNTNSTPYTIYAPSKNTNPLSSGYSISLPQIRSQATTPSTGGREDVGIEVMPPSRPTSIAENSLQNPPSATDRTYLSPDDALNHPSLP
ncbi:hypothetical protein AX16_006308 [Volvariella volvacea WC 439]|nr:hypothetical protein AX16_006308 [Volvariella volvacea WC 439]